MASGIKQGKQKGYIKHNASVPPNITNQECIYPTVPVTPVVNNVYQDHRFHQGAVVMPPLVTNYGGLHSNPVYYAKTLSPISSNYPQQVYVIPQSTVNNVIHNYPYTVTTHQVHIHNTITTTQPIIQQPNYGNGQIPQITTTYNLSLKNYSSVHPVEINSTTESSVNVSQSTSEEKNHLQTTPVSSSVLQNGVKTNPIKENTTTASPANKSWASLFSSNKSNNDINSQSLEIETEKPVMEKAINKEFNNNEPLCPIKHPRKTQFIDPDCYRMGGMLHLFFVYITNNYINRFVISEYLTNYSVDGRAVSLQPRGLINQSNYCYINSILQALIACPPLYNLLSGLAQNISSNEKRKPTPVIDGM